MPNDCDACAVRVTIEKLGRLRERERERERGLSRSIRASASRTRSYQELYKKGKEEEMESAATDTRASGEFHGRNRNFINNSSGIARSADCDEELFETLTSLPDSSTLTVVCCSSTESSSMRRARLGIPF